MKCVKNGLQVFVNWLIGDVQEFNWYNEKQYKFYISSYSFYDHGNRVNNSFTENIYSNATAFYINDKYYTTGFKYVQNIHKLLNELLIDKLSYPWLIKFINSEDKICKVPKYGNKLFDINFCDILKKVEVFTL